MADEQDKWLDREAAERLLRGEPLGAVDPHARAQADRLARALGALAATDPSAAPGGSGAAPGELPGEAAALAAFRAARSGPATDARASAAYATSAHEAAAAETVRRSRDADRPRPSRWGRPVRFGLAATLAACMAGGVAVAAGTGVLSSPFSGHDAPAPASSVSAAATPEASRTTPSAEPEEPSEKLLPDGTAPPGEEPTREPHTRTPPEAEAGGEHPGAATPLPDAEGTPPVGGDTKKWHRKVISACRDYRSGVLQGDKRRRLEEAAKGSSRVEDFCGRILGGTAGGVRHGGGAQGGGQSGGGRSGGDGGGADGGSGGGAGGSSGGEAGGGAGGSSGGEAGGSSGGDTIPAPGLPHPTPTTAYSALPHFPHPSR
ncbi:hypothetical protein ABZ383_26200 [Streptomyces sp. NPDC005900]|uniref:hypothetical protein n=1 Tax=Streptomyces sp. NPDC005900 TaxID=3154569 RepID=UPI0033E0AE1E